MQRLGLGAITLARVLCRSLQRIQLRFSAFDTFQPTAHLAHLGG